MHVCIAFQRVVGIRLARKGSSVLWQQLGLGASGNKAFMSRLSVLCGCGGSLLFESWLSVLCGCGDIS